MSSICQLADIRDWAYALLEKTKDDPNAYAMLARSYVVILDAIRILRGVPLPGSLRPDLDPQQLRRALRRAKLRVPDSASIVDIAMADKLPPSTDPDEATGRRRPRPRKPAPTTTSTEPDADPNARDKKKSDEAVQPIVEELPEEEPGED